MKGGEGSLSQLKTSRGKAKFSSSWCPPPMNCVCYSFFSSFRQSIIDMKWNEFAWCGQRRAFLHYKENKFLDSVEKTLWKKRYLRTFMKKSMRLKTKKSLQRKMYLNKKKLQGCDEQNQKDVKTFIFWRKKINRNELPENVQTFSSGIESVRNGDKHHETNCHCHSPSPLHCRLECTHTNVFSTAQNTVINACYQR